MNAEKLISMASARGIDMSGLVKQPAASTRKGTVTYARCGLRITQLLPQSRMQAHGRETRTIDEPEWSSADVGFALAGLDRAPTLAALFAWAGHHENYWPLVVQLRTAAIRLRRQSHWPELIEDYSGMPFDYIESLCEMVLFDDQHPGVLDYAPQAGIGQDDQSGILRAIHCRTILPTWKRQLADRYSQVVGVWVDWLDIAARHVQRRIHDGYDE